MRPSLHQIPPKSRPKDNFNQFFRIFYYFFVKSSHTERKILYYLGQYIQAEENYENFKRIFISHKLIAKKCNCSTKTVYRLIKKMKGLFVNTIQNRRRMGQYTTNTYTFDEDFSKIIRHFYRLKLFNGIKSKKSYNKYIKNRIQKVNKYLEKYEDLQEIYHLIEAKTILYKKRKLSMKMSFGHMFNKDFFYLHKTTLRETGFINKKLKILKIPWKEKIHFSKHTEDVIYRALERLETVIRNKGRPWIKNLVKFLQYLIIEEVRNKYARKNEKVKLFARA